MDYSLPFRARSLPSQNRQDRCRRERNPEGVTGERSEKANREDRKRMKVLVVGGAGYVGGAVTDLLLSGRHEFRVFDGLLYEEDYRKRVPFFYGDVRDRESLLPHLAWADAVIWLAALVGDGACALNPEIAAEINHTSLSWLARTFDGRIIFLSTCSVYGAQDRELDEDSPTDPLSVYAVTKLAARTKPRAEYPKEDVSETMIRTLTGYLHR